jgi:hypothetical protein
VSRAQRLTFLAIAVAIAVVAVVILASSGSDEEEAPSPAAQATPTPTPTPGEETTPAPEATPEPTRPPHKPEPPTLTQGKVTKLRFQEGDIVRFQVRSDVADHVHVHGYDLMKDVAAGQTITMSFPASITGIFEIELEDRAEQIGQLRVDPD